MPFRTDPEFCCWSATVFVGMLELTVRSNSSKSSGLKSRPGNCPYAPVAWGSGVVVTRGRKFPNSKRAGRNASEPRRSLVNELEKPIGFKHHALSYIFQTQKYINHLEAGYAIYSMCLPNRCSVLTQMASIYTWIAVGGLPVGNACESQFIW